MLYDDYDEIWYDDDYEGEDEYEDDYYDYDEDW